MNLNRGLEIKNVLVFGASGFIGSAICESLLDSQTWNVIGVSRNDSPRCQVSLSDSDWVEKIKALGPVHGIVWAQGTNTNDTIESAELEDVENTFRCNVLFIIKTLKSLLEHEVFASSVRAVVISSVWQSLVRPGKFSYAMSKSAIGSLVPSLAVDLQARGIVVNAVLPGVIDSPMAIANLSSDEIKRVKEETFGGKLVQAQEVANVTTWLLSEKSSGINGESIAVDNGWSKARYV